MKRFRQPCSHRSWLLQALQLLQLLQQAVSLGTLVLKQVLHALG
jgi:hypothetical protein